MKRLNGSIKKAKEILDIFLIKTQFSINLKNLPWIIFFKKKKYMKIELCIKGYTQQGEKATHGMGENMQIAMSKRVNIQTI